MRQIQRIFVLLRAHRIFIFFSSLQKNVLFRRFAYTDNVSYIRCSTMNSNENVAESLTFPATLGTRSMSPITEDLYQIFHRPT